MIHTFPQLKLHQHVEPNFEQTQLHNKNQQFNTTKRIKKSGCVFKTLRHRWPRSSVTSRAMPWRKAVGWWFCRRIPAAACGSGPPWPTCPAWWTFPTWGSRSLGKDVGLRIFLPWMINFQCETFVFDKLLIVEAYGLTMFNFLFCWWFLRCCCSFSFKSKHAFFFSFIREMGKEKTCSDFEGWDGNCHAYLTNLFNVQTKGLCPRRSWEMMHILFFPENHD